VRVAVLPPEAVFDEGPDRLTALAGTLFFTVGRRDTGVELWSSDGSEAGTRLVKDVRPGADGSNPAELVAAGGVLFFTADDGASGRELWRSDGTAQGTVRVADLNAGVGSFPQELTAVGERLYFTAVRGGVLRELWVSDGTAAGTVPVDGVPALPSGSPPQGLRAVGNDLFLVADDGEAGAELWRVDSAGVAMLVHDVNPGPADASPRALVDWHGMVCFFASHPDDIDLWCSDGTPEGTTGIASGAVLPGSLTTSGDLLYFAAVEPFPRSEIHPGRDLWRSDGTSAGTYRLGILHGDVRGGVSYSLVDFNGTLLYSVSSGFPSGQRFGRSDGTPKGTFVIFSEHVSSLTVAAGAVYFAVCDEPDQYLPVQQRRNQHYGVPGLLPAAADAATGTAVMS
jgi:ELWxxDGT repeat protein